MRHKIPIFKVRTATSQTRNTSILCCCFVQRSFLLLLIDFYVSLLYRLLTIFNHIHNTYITSKPPCLPVTYHVYVLQFTRTTTPFTSLLCKITLLSLFFRLFSLSPTQLYTQLNRFTYIFTLYSIHFSFNRLMDLISHETLY